LQRAGAMGDARCAASQRGGGECCAFGNGLTVLGPSGVIIAPGAPWRRLRAAARRERGGGKKREGVRGDTLELRTCDNEGPARRQQ
jgi:hypothetical protein